jgi:hypothetical protein
MHDPASPPAGAALRVSRYERVVGMMMAAVALLTALVAILGCVWVDGELAPRPNPIVLVILGGDPEAAGELAPPVVAASVQDFVAETEVDAPQADAALAAIADLVAEIEAALDDPRIAEADAGSGGGASATSGDAAPRGEGQPAGGGVPSYLRWLVYYDSGASLDEYARQLDFFGIELAAFDGRGRLEYAANLAASTPTTRAAAADQERRLCFSWRDGPRQQADRELLRRAGIDAGGKTVLQCFGPQLESLLEGLEAASMRQAHRRRDLRHVRRTRFGVRAAGDGYEFYVIDVTFF